MRTCGGLGFRIRRFREERGVGRAQLAENTGLSEKFLQSLEEDDLYPSIGPLQKVARALGVRLGTFMDDEITRDPVITRAGARGVDLVMHKARDSRDGLIYHSLGKGKSDRNMEPFRVEMPPEESGGHKLSSHQGEEFILVTKGRLLLIYGREEHILEPGDTAYYNSIVPHYVGASGGEPAELVAVIYYP